MMSWKSEESTHDTFLLEQKLNYYLLVVNPESTRDFLEPTRRKKKLESTRERI